MKEFRETKNNIVISSEINKEIFLYQSAYRKVGKFLKKELIILYIIDVGLEQFIKERISLENSIIKLLKK